MSRFHRIRIHEYTWMFGLIFEYLEHHDVISMRSVSNGMRRIVSADKCVFKPKATNYLALSYILDMSAMAVLHIKTLRNLNLFTACVPESRIRALIVDHDSTSYQSPLSEAGHNRIERAFQFLKFLAFSPMIENPGDTRFSTGFSTEYLFYMKKILSAAASTGIDRLILPMHATDALRNWLSPMTSIRFLNINLSYLEISKDGVPFILANFPSLVHVVFNIEIDPTNPTKPLVFLHELPAMPYLETISIMFHSQHEPNSLAYLTIPNSVVSLDYSAAIDFAENFITQQRTQFPRLRSIKCMFYNTQHLRGRTLRVYRNVNIPPIIESTTQVYTHMARAIASSHVKNVKLSVCAYTNVFDHLSKSTTADFYLNIHDDLELSEYSKVVMEFGSSGTEESSSSFSSIPQDIYSLWATVNFIKERRRSGAVAEQGIDLEEIDLSGASKYVRLELSGLGDNNTRGILQACLTDEDTPGMILVTHHGAEVRTDQRKITSRMPKIRKSTKGLDSQPKMPWLGDVLCELALTPWYREIFKDAGISEQLWDPWNTDSM